MEEQKSSSDKIQTLWINPYSTTQTVLDKLELPLQTHEYSIVVIGQHDLNELFQLINKSMQSKTLLKNLLIRFETVKSLKFEDTIYQLKDIKQITNLSLDFTDNTSFHSLQYQNLSECLLLFSNLTHLNIEMSCELLKSKENLFRLYDYFKESPQLESLEIRTDYTSDRSRIFESLLEGIRFLKNLKKFMIHSECSKAQCDVVISLLEEELAEINSIKELSLEFGYQTLITNNDFLKIGRILRKLQQLEKLTLFANSSIQKEVQESIQLHHDISTLKNLKELKLTFERDLYFNYCGFIEGIAEMTHLENVVLELYLMNKLQINNDLVLFAQSIAKIQNLSKLDISFDYDFADSDILNGLLFVTNLSPLQKLTSYSVYLSSMSPDSESDMPIHLIDFSLFRDVVNRLKQFTFKKNVDQQFYKGNHAIRVYRSLCDTTNLEELVVEFNNYYDEENCEKQQLEYCDFLQKSTNLKDISLHYDHDQILDKNQLLSIFKRLQFNPQLTQITLSLKNSIIITEEHFEELSKGLIQLNSLNSLSLTFNQNVNVNDEGMSNLAHHLSQMKLLKYLMLGFSKDFISSNRLNEIIKSVSKIPKLRNYALKISGKSFLNDEEESSFANSFTLQKKLFTLEIILTIPDLKYRNLENIFSQTSSLKKLENLYLGFQFESRLEDCLKIQEYLSNLKLLRLIQFNCFSFQLMHLIKLFDSLPLLTDIEFFNEYKNHSQIVKAYKKILLSDEGEIREKTKLKIQNEKFFSNEDYEKENATEIVPFILQGMANLSKLKLYFLEENNIGSDYSSLLFSNMKTLKNLEYLKVQIHEDNQIGTDSINILGEVLIELPQLKKLQVVIMEKNNNITWRDCSFFSHSLSQLKQLEFLEVVLQFPDFYENNENDTTSQEELVVTLLKSISNLTSLHTLELVIQLKELTPNVEEQFHSTCVSLKQNLRVLSLLFEFEHTLDNNKSINKSIRQLTNLTSIMLNQELIYQLEKLKRLVSFSPREPYYPKFDYS